MKKLSVNYFFIFLIEINPVNFGFVNFICIVYKPKKGKSDLQIRDAISKFGLRSNAENDPAGDLLLEDVFIEGCYAIDQGFIKLTGAMYQDIEIIRKKIGVDSHKRVIRYYSHIRDLLRSERFWLPIRIQANSRAKVWRLLLARF